VHVGWTIEVRSPDCLGRTLVFALWSANLVGLFLFLNFVWFPY